MKGKFITFEGPEGCGKSTQSRWLKNFLKTQGYDVVFVREPGATKIGEKIRRILLDNRNESLSPITEMLLYMASRAQLVTQIIKPALAQGKIVICDRFLDSTIAYQGYGLGLDIASIKHIGHFATQGVRPDLTILLDAPLKESLQQRKRLKDRIERRPLTYHRRVKKGYFLLAQKEPRRIKIVKISKDKLQTQKKIREVVINFLQARAKDS